MSRRGRTVEPGETFRVGRFEFRQPFRLPPEWRKEPSEQETFEEWRRRTARQIAALQKRHK